MTQADAILHWLQHDPITPADALREFGCMRLAARISDLRAKGHQIYTEIISENGKDFARYHLARRNIRGHEN
jgi:hypothetical protein